MWSKRVKTSYIRKVKGDTSRTSEDETYFRGDKIEARYNGKSKWYGGKIKRANIDGTYNVEYDDGDVERNVRPVHIRLSNVSTDGSDSDRGTGKRRRGGKSHGKNIDSDRHNTWKLLRRLALEEGVKNPPSLSDIAKERSDEKRLRLILGDKAIRKYRRAFDKYDRDGNGDLSVREVYKTLREMGRHVSMKEVKAWIRDRDEDNSGTVDFIEFVKADAGISFRLADTYDDFRDVERIQRRKGAHGLHQIAKTIIDVMAV